MNSWNAPHTGMLLRQLASDQQCAATTALNTTYNAINEVVPYVGIMFSVFSNNPLDILGMELDLRLEGEEDLSVEVYTFRGRFESVRNDPSVWTKVADTKAIPAPEGVGAIIPVNDFTTVSMGRDERVSFYVTMKAPLIDYNVAALSKTDELALKTRDLDLFVGAGLSEYKFPEEFDDLVDPQFTGVLHYARTTECGRTTTSIKYLFIVNENLRPETLRDLNKFVNTTVNDIMIEDDDIQQLQTAHNLEILSGAETTFEVYPGKTYQNER